MVYGVRSRRDTDTFFKRFTAESFYHVMNALGAEDVYKRQQHIQIVGDAVVAADLVADDVLGADNDDHLGLGQ